MTEGRWCHNHNGLYARIFDHCTVIVVDRNPRARKPLTTASAADGRETDSWNILQQMLDIAAAMAADSDEPNSKFLWRSTQHEIEKQSLRVESYFLTGCIDKAAKRSL